MPTPKKTALTSTSPAKGERLTPEQIREAFLANQEARKQVIDGIAVYPISLAILCLLESIEHPFQTGGKPVMEDGKPKRDEQGNVLTAPLTTREIAEAIFVFSDPLGAQETFFKSRAAFDAAVLQMIGGIGVATARKLCAAIGEQMAEARKDQAEPGAA